MSDASADPPAPNTSSPGTDTGSAIDRAALKDQMRQQMIDGFGGWSGMAIAALPTVVFVVVNAVNTLRAAVIAAVATALVLMGYRLARRQPLQQAASGLFGVVIAAAIAARTGQARGYFLVGIWSSFAYGAAFLISMVLRRPLVGVIWEFLDPTPATGSTGSSTVAEHGAGMLERAAPEQNVQPWYRRPVLARAYLLATAAATLVFALRAVVQLSLFRHNSTGWLAVARLAMGYPLTIAAIGFAVLVVRRARARLVTAQL